MNMREKVCGIYKVTNNINQKVYIGQSVDIYSRWNHHKSCCKNEKCHEYNTPFYRALRKYGEDNFTFEILEQCDIEELDDKEINPTFKDYIKYLSASTTFKSSYIMVMERCTSNDDKSKNIDDCKYAYLEIYDGKE